MDRIIAKSKRGGSGGQKRGKRRKEVELETEEEVIDSELVHNVAVVLVEVLGLSILLVTIPYPLSLNVEQC